MDIIIGDDVRLPISLTINDLTFSIGIAATVKTRVVRSDHSGYLSAEITQSRLTTGADWTISLVVVAMSAAETAAITEYPGPTLLEIQVDDSIKQTWFTPVQIVRGQIA